MTKRTNKQQSHTILILSEKERINDLQLAFNKALPFLKIEFYKKPLATKTENQKHIESSLPLAAAGLIHSGTMDIDDSITVHQLEKELKNNFGLNAHVFRKSGNMWLEITMTGDWTLKRQNEHGRELSEPYTIEPLKDLEAPDNSLE